ncbi:energy-coupling factor transporter ATPase [Tissierella sp. MB52-C2]|uniref:ABC transporter ATP-binding protein n=1 Tax=Tissierella sp. MB52-C2 TaxID=3070999 RepID=UPI00280B5B2E|nr:energy-coupling factor transporter ATPase [Tissierella sp. MB52-C2]WMM25163.1 energy-coupling factor transporter ATPase [Tissierella sp. MB52-C2]
MLHIRNLSLAFPEKGKVFDNLNFSIKKNRITLLSGDSGCGKSSLLMCIARVIPRTIEGTITGEIIYNGLNIEEKGVEAISGNIGYMFQDPDSQLCTFTVEDEIAFGLENININPDEMDGIIDNVLELTGIKHLRKRKLNELSGGEKQKVALSSILAIDPELILMDEPTANLDPVSTQETIELIRKLRKDMGKTILIVEHKVKEFQDIIDEVIHLDEKGASIIDKDIFLESYAKKSKLPERNKRENSEESILEVSKISFSYNNSIRVLDDISICLYKNEIAAIVGPNGAGKSTLTKILMGLIRPEKGQILINGVDINKMTPLDIGGNMGLIFQNPEHQFIKMTVEKEMALSLELRGENQKDIDSKVKHYLELFELSEHKDMNPFSLSQGQKRRLSTACMLINGQPILILDEPTYGQDRENLQKLLKLLYEINNKGISILMITHDMELVESSCDRYIFLSRGKIRDSGRVLGGFEKNLEMEKNYD